MMQLIKNGTYRLIETKHNTKVLSLDDDTYAWVEPPAIGEILVVTHVDHVTDCILSLGRYNLYDVKDEPGVTDMLHLELEVGQDVWQGYLLLTGLPNDEKKKARIIPTREIIS
ncbi:hypothetical protein EOL96_05170 [Candidatus Saccharibacteria bacterium]|nr:hypothetical protein [Candidatus Saccharibacteria bacterium]